MPRVFLVRKGPLGVCGTVVLKMSLRDILQGSWWEGSRSQALSSLHLSWVKRANPTPSLAALAAMGQAQSWCRYMADWLSVMQGGCTVRTGEQDNDEEIYTPEVDETTQVKLTTPHQSSVITEEKQIGDHGRATWAGHCRRSAHRRHLQPRPTLKEISLYRKQRHVIKQELKERFTRHRRVARMSPSTSADLLEASKIIAAEVGINVQVHGNGELGQLRRVHVLGDGNCWWRAYAKARRTHTRMKTSWQKIKRKALKSMGRPEQDAYLQGLRAYGSWGDNVAIIMTVARWGGGVNIHTGQQMISFSSGDELPSMQIGFEKNHFFPLMAKEYNRSVSNGDGHYSKLDDSGDRLQQPPRPAERGSPVGQGIGFHIWAMMRTMLHRGVAVPQLVGGMQNPDEEEPESPEEARRYRQLQRERYYLWLSDLEREYDRLLLRLNDQQEDWSYMTEEAPAQGPARTRMIFRLLGIMDLVKDEAEPIRRIAELTAATPTPWGAYVEVIYNAEFRWAARHMGGIAQDVEQLTREAIQELHTPDPDLGKMERMLELIMQSIREARSRITAARQDDLTDVVFGMDTSEIPAAPSSSPRIQGGMLPHRGQPRPKRAASPQRIIRTEAEYRLMDDVDNWLASYRRVLLRLHVIMDELEMVEEGRKQQRFFVAGHINMARNYIGLYRQEADEIHRLANDIGELRFPWGAYVNPHYVETVTMVSQHLGHIANTMVENWSAAHRELETQNPALDDIIHMIDLTADILRHARKPIAVLRSSFNLTLREYEPQEVIGGANTCSSTFPYDPREDVQILYGGLPSHLREHREQLLTPAGTQTAVWHMHDEVAWFLLLAGWHPYFYVLTIRTPEYEYTMRMDVQMQDVPSGHRIVQLRANCWSCPSQIPPMFGGGEELDPAMFSKLIQQVVPLMPGVKRDKIKLLLRGVPGLRTKISKNIGDGDKVRALMKDHAKRYAIDLEVPNPAGSAGSRAKSAEPPSAARRKSSLRPKGHKSDTEQHKDDEKKVAFKKEQPKTQAPEQELHLLDEWSVPVRKEFNSAQPGVYLSESLAEITSWASQVRNMKIAVAVISPYAYEVAGLEKPKNVIANMKEVKGTIEKQVAVKAWILNLGLVEVTSKARAGEIIYDKPVKKSLVTTVDVDVGGAPEEWQRALKERKPADIRALLATLIASPEAVHDVWQIGEVGAGTTRFKARFVEEQMLSIMKCSGQHGVFINTPMHMPKRMALIWLRDADHTVDLDYAMNKIKLLENHYGIIRKDASSYAIRCDYDAQQEVKKILNMDTAHTWRVEGLPLEFGQQEVRSLLAQLGWETQVLPKSRTCRKGRAAWTIKAETEPDKVVYPVLVGDASYTVQIGTNRVEPTQRRPEEPKVVKGAFTWSDLFKGKLVAEKKKKDDSQGTAEERGKKRNSTEQVEPPAAAFQANHSGMPAGAHQQTSPKRQRQGWAEHDMSMNDNSDSDDAWCEETSEMMQAQREMKKRQDALELKLEQIMGAIQKLSVQQPTSPPEPQQVEGGGENADKDL